jgi:hypothetical protein
LPEEEVVVDQRGAFILLVEEVLEVIENLQEQLRLIQRLL